MSTNKKKQVISSTRKRTISKLKRHKSVLNRRLIFSSSSKTSRTPANQQNNSPIASVPEILSDSESSLDFAVNRRLLVLSSTSSESDEQKSLGSTKAESSTENFTDIESDEGTEIWCRGICNILPIDCNDEDERSWIQCYKCGGWWHQEHANLRCMNDNYIKKLKWCCVTIGIPCPCDTDITQSPLWSMKKHSWT